MRLFASLVNPSKKCYNHAMKTKWLKPLLAVLFWLLVWYLMSIWVHSPLLLASPIAVAQRLTELIVTPAFWLTIFRSLLGILAGFALAVVVGCLFASFSYHVPLIRDLFSPLLSIIKTIPVACFIILVLVWIKSAYIATAISFLMVLPIIYFNIYLGYHQVDEKLLEVAAVYHVPLMKKYRYLYLPMVLPQFFLSLQTGVAFAFKSGVAAEVIGLSRHTIGYMIYNAKVNLESADLLAWTVVIVLLSWLCEYLITVLVSLLKRRRALP